MEKSAEPGDPVGKPHDRDKCVSVAYLRLLGMTQGAAADAAGVAVRQLREWEKCSWWPDVQGEAADRWFKHITAKTRVGVEKLLNEVDGQTVRWSAERLIGEFAPPTTRTDLTTGGEKLPLSFEVVFVKPDCTDDG